MILSKSSIHVQFSDKDNIVLEWFKHAEKKFDLQKPIAWVSTGQLFAIDICKKFRLALLLPL